MSRRRFEDNVGLAEKRVGTKPVTTPEDDLLLAQIQEYKRLRENGEPYKVVFTPHKTKFAKGAPQVVPR